jgi:MinD superfamily P-loop ATPase
MVPGTSCPVIAAMNPAAFEIPVTEPTVAGRRDMERVVDLAHFLRFQPCHGLRQ